MAGAEKKVLNVVKAFKLTDINGAIRHFEVGLYEVEAWIADHWYVKHHSRPPEPAEKGDLFDTVDLLPAPEPVGQQRNEQVVAPVAAPASPAPTEAPTGAPSAQESAPAPAPEAATGAMGSAESAADSDVAGATGPVGASQEPAPAGATGPEGAGAAEGAPGTTGPAESEGEGAGAQS